MNNGEHYHVESETKKFDHDWVVVYLIWQIESRFHEREARVGATIPTADNEIVINTRKTLSLSIMGLLSYAF